MATKNYTDPRTVTLDEDKERTFPLKSAKDLDPLLDRIGDARCVMLGEASHGTHEYYTWRTAITKRLIQEKGFNFIAVEGDWPACYAINRFIKGYSDKNKKTTEILAAFERWPTWMWANWEIVSLIDWLANYNKSQYANKRIGFYGLDVYSLWESMDTLVEYLEKNDPKAAALAKKAVRCFEPYGEDEHLYASSQYTLEDSCKEPLIQLLQEIRKKAPVYDHDLEAALNTEQNAQIAVNAEEYYRNMVGFNDNTWNLRDTHMVETLNRLFEFHGHGAKAIVWEHNTHIGDARYTDMKKAGMINVGQLVREQRGDKDVVLVGFGSYQGTVIAGESWGAPMGVMQVPEARPESVEEILHSESAENKLLIFDSKNKKERFNKIMPHRAIGVVYNPPYEKYSNYVPTVLNSRYDAFLYIDVSTALHPLYLEPDGHKIPETYPFEY
ncbi:erythromycin esterase family protein [Rubrolithibacter danxiaensis]|uniref:erythromycin esterase family protein n=1 Tax=Rubrolithibacter danxiaensis TaxID=3390805 RepID=UPI003BF7B95F